MRISTAKCQTNCRCLLLMCPTCFQLEYLTPNMYLSTVSENQLHICFISLKSGRYMYLIIIFFDFIYTVFCLLCFWRNWESFAVPYIFSFCFVVSDVMSAAKSVRKNTCAWSFLKKPHFYVLLKNCSVARVMKLRLFLMLSLSVRSLQ